MNAPLVRNKVPPWDLGVVLKFLSGAPFETRKGVSFSDVTRKALFLLALASGKRRGELHALSREGLSWNHLRLDKFQELCDKTHRSVFLRLSMDLQGIAGGKLSILGETEVYLDSASCLITLCTNTKSYSLPVENPMADVTWSTLVSGPLVTQ